MTKGAACCSVGRAAAPDAAAPDDAAVGDVVRSERETVVGASPAGGGVDPEGPEGRVRIPAGTFRMGTDAPTFPADGEGPIRRVRLSAFEIDRYAVTNARFARFVRATGWVTDAERFGWSFVFHTLVADDARVGGAPPDAPWWRQTFGATWRAPFGGGSTCDGRWDHPVVHVGWRDAAAFAAWAGGRLPSEAEWERAARGGLDQATFPWGDELEPGGRHVCNVWQGDFPHRDEARDGYAGTAPVDAFAPNAFGLHNVVGNVWEWCQDRFTASHDPRPATDPRGPEDGVGRVMKGGSYLCHASYCNRYRVAARTSGQEDDGLGNVGFRVAYDAGAAARRGA